MKKIVYLPLDERPCNYNYPYWLSKCSKGYQFYRPSKAILGNKKTPAIYENVKRFLLEKCKTADILIISLETLIYGGLLFSRLHDYSAEILIDRLRLIEQLKKNNPSLKIYAFSLILRCPSCNTDDEEPDYYGECGEAIFNTGVLKHKYLLSLIDKEEYEQGISKLKNITKNWLIDFEKRRETNLKVITYFLENYYNLCEFFVIPQDDSNPYGYTTMDREKVKKIIKELGLDVPIYPGADEVGCVLLARALKDDKKIEPSINIVFPKPECQNVIPIFEDRPVYLSLKDQLKVVGFHVDDKKANVSLFMNYPTREMVNMGSIPSIGYEERDIDSFIQKIVNDVKNKKQVILSDGAYGNGGEELFLVKLQSKISLFEISSYAGWNTSSNAMGTALALGMINFLFGKTEKSNEFIAQRIYEDIGYMGKVRWHIWHDVVQNYGYCYDFVGAKNGIIAKITLNEINSYAKKTFPEVFKKYKISHLEFPWKRIFEVDLRIKNQQR